MSSNKLLFIAIIVITDVKYKGSHLLHDDCLFRVLPEMILNSIYQKLFEKLLSRERPFRMLCIIFLKFIHKLFFFISALLSFLSSEAFLFSQSSSVFFFFLHSQVKMHCSRSIRSQFRCISKYRSYHIHIPVDHSHLKHDARLVPVLFHIFL